jgi:glycerol-1-phosphate dehydrogenase [NAD(P)+]
MVQRRGGRLVNEMESLRERALNPVVRFGRGIAQRDIAALADPYMLLTQPPVMPALPDGMARNAVVLEHVASLEEAELERLLSRFATARAAVGVGGGVVMDASKYVSWKTGCPLYLVPSILSADACVTNTIGVRHGHNITYEGFVVAEAVVVDPLVLTTAPERLNRSGLGDLLSIHTGLWDWKRGASLGLVEFDDAVADEARATFEAIAALADEIAAVSDLALEQIVRSFASINCLVVRLGHAQMQEGSEHFFAYAMEAQTGKSFVHGEILGLGAVLMTKLQDNDQARVVRLLDRCKIGWRPADQGLSNADVVTCLVGLKDYVESAGWPYSIANEVDLDDRRAQDLLGAALEIEKEVD